MKANATPEPRALLALCSSMLNRKVGGKVKVYLTCNREQGQYMFVNSKSERRCRPGQKTDFKKALSLSQLLSVKQDLLDGP